jgi:hypothetical protein
LIKPDASLQIQDGLEIDFDQRQDRENKLALRVGFARSPNG